MAYDERLAERIRTTLGGRDDVEEKRMFGGLAFMVAGSMACGIVGSDLMARVGDERFDAALARPHARLMDFTGKPLRGFVLVGAAGVRTAAQLKKWVDETVSFATSAEQRAKQKKTAAKKKRAAKPVAAKKRAAASGRSR
jgi:hypothetical protein